MTQDPWLLDADSGIISTDLGANFDTDTVNNLMNTSDHGWDRDLIMDIFNMRDQALILNIPFSYQNIAYHWSM